MSGLDLTVLDRPIVFRERPIAIPGGDRLEWRVAALILVMSRCRGRQTSLAALHVLVWALSNSRTRATFGAWWEGRRSLATSTFRFDPIVDKTVDVVLGCGLVEVRGSGKIRLTDAGLRLASAIDSNGDVLSTEKSFLLALPGTLSESEIGRRLGWGSGT
jgi:hypothetical protein